MKKILSLVLSVLFLLTALPTFTVFADTDAKVIGTLDKATVCPGDEVTLTVSIENNPGLVCWLIDVEYDDSALTLVAQEKGEAYASIGAMSFSPMTSPANALWYDFLALENYTNNGTLFHFTFQVKEDAAYGNYPITLYCSDYDNMCDVDLNRVNFDFISTSIEVTEHIHTYDNNCDATCNECGETRTITHAYDSVVVNATCNKSGLITNTCSVCGTVDTEVIPATGKHTYVNADNPTCSSCGAALSLSGPTIYGVVDKATLTHGSTFTLSVVMDNNPGLASWLVECGYDEDVLELTKMTSGGVFSGVSFGPLVSPANGLWFDFLTGDNTTNGVLYTATFTVKEDAPLGASAITLFCSDAENICNFDFDPVSFAFMSTEIVVSEHIHTYDNTCDTTCNECGETRAITHTYTAETVEPTCGQDGLTTYTCSVCGAIDSEVIPATGKHTYVNASNPVCGGCGEALVITGPTVYGVLDKNVIARDYTFTLSVVMENNPGLVGWLIDVDYDDSKLELIQQAKGEAFASVGAMSFSPKVSPANTLWYDFLATENYTNNGTLFTFTFRVKEDAAFGASPITLYCSDSANMCDVDYNEVKFTFVNTTVNIVDHVHTYDADCAIACNVCGETREPLAEHTYDHACDADCNACGAVREVKGHEYTSDCDVDCDICGTTREPLAEHTYTHRYDADCDICGAVHEVEYMPGDLNYDGKVNIRDLGLLQQHLNSWELNITPAFDPFFADLNADGRVNIRDLGLLQQYLNSWDVELKLAV